MSEAPLVTGKAGNPEDLAEVLDAEPEEFAAESEMIEGDRDFDGLLSDLHAWITSGLDIAEALLATAPSRELAITHTKLEEAEMWLVKLYHPGEEVSE